MTKKKQNKMLERMQARIEDKPVTVTAAAAAAQQEAANKRTVRLNFTVSPREQAYYIGAARQQRTTISDVCRKALVDRFGDVPANFHVQEDEK